MKFKVWEECHKEVSEEEIEHPSGIHYLAAKKYVGYVEDEIDDGEEFILCVLSEVDPIPQRFRVACVHRVDITPL